MSLPECRWPRLADPTDIPRLISGDRVFSGIPPPGTTLIPTAHPEPWGLVCGEPTGAQVGDWYVEPLSEFTLGINADLVELAARLGARFVGPVATFAGTLAAWPVIYEVGSVVSMRFIRVTLKGELGQGVEQFQTGFNLGNPGNDPTLDEAGALTLGGQINTVMADLWFDQITGLGTPGELFSNEVKFTEIGVAEVNQEDPSAQDGSGGAQTQSYPTQWTLMGGGLTGLVSTASLPFEVATCVTLQTDYAGPSGRGRMYLPPFAATIMTGDGLFVSESVVTAGRWIGDLFDGIRAVTTLEPIVVSRRQRQLRLVERIYVGHVPDAQRRRRRSQDENRALAWTKTA